MKRLNKTTLRFSFFCVFFISKGNILDFNFTSLQLVGVGRGMRRRIQPRKLHCGMKILNKNQVSNSCVSFQRQPLRFSF